MTRKVEVLPYDAAWAEAFREEAARLAAVFGAEAVAIHHIGSTAVPGLCAKPIIDILVEVRVLAAVDALNEALRARGYDPRGEHGLPGRRYFVKRRGGVRTHHVHVFAAGSPDVARHLAFCAYLRVHPEEAQAYGALKRRLAREHPEDIESYVQGKGTFVRALERRACAWVRARQLP